MRAVARVVLAGVILGAAVYALAWRAGLAELVQEWRGYYTLVLEPATLAAASATTWPGSRSVLPHLNGADLGELVSAHTARVRITTFAGAEWVTVAGLAARLDELDPRYDPYLRALPAWFTTTSAAGAAQELVFVPSALPPALVAARLARALSGAGVRWHLVELAPTRVLAALLLFTAGAVAAGCRRWHRLPHGWRVLLAVPWVLLIVNGGLPIAVVALPLYAVGVWLAERHRRLPFAVDLLTGTGALAGAVLVIGWTQRLDPAFAAGVGVAVAAQALLTGAALLFRRRPLPPGGGLRRSRGSATGRTGRDGPPAPRPFGAAPASGGLGALAGRLDLARRSLLGTRLALLLAVAVLGAATLRGAPEHRVPRPVAAPGFTLAAGIMVREAAQAQREAGRVQGEAGSGQREAGQAHREAASGQRDPGSAHRGDGRPLRGAGSAEDGGGRRTLRGVGSAEDRVGFTLRGLQAAGLAEPGALPVLADYVAHVAYQEALPFGRSYALPAPDEQVTVTRYVRTAGGGRLLQEEEEVFRFSDEWLRATLAAAPPASVAALLIAQGRPVAAQVALPARAPPGVPLAWPAAMIALCVLIAALSLRRRRRPRSASP